MLFCALFGNIIDVAPLHPLKVLAKLVINQLDGIVIDFKLKQFWNDCCILIPLEDTEVGNVIELNKLQALNAACMVVRFGIEDWKTIPVIELLPEKQLANVLALKLVGKTIFFKLVQLWNADEKS